MEDQDDHRRTELLHRLRILHQVAKVARVVFPAGEGGGEQHVLARQHARVVAVAVGELRPRSAARLLLRRKPVRGDVITVIAVFDQRGAPAFVARIGQAGNEHPPGQRIDAMGADRAAGRLLEVVNGFHVARTRGLGVNVEDEDPAALQAGEPELATVIREPAVMRFVASAN